MRVLLAAVVLVVLASLSFPGCSQAPADEAKLDAPALQACAGNLLDDCKAVMQDARLYAACVRDGISACAGR